MTNESNGNETQQEPQQWSKERWSAFIAKTFVELRKQGRQSVNESMDSGGTCKYRTKDGLRCAIGVHIPEEQYNENWDEGANTAINYKKEICQLLELEHDHDIQIAVRVQKAHDRCDIADFVGDLQQFLISVCIGYNIPIPPELEQ